MSALQGSLVQNPLDIPGIRQLAGLSKVVPHSEFTAEQIQQLFKAWGNNAAFAQNVAGLRTWFDAPGDIPNQNVLDLLQATGMLERQPLRTVYGPVTAPIQPLVLLTGATTNWMQRRIAEMDAVYKQGMVTPRAVMGLASTVRLCNLPTEINHPLVKGLSNALHEQRTPTEAEMLQDLFSHSVPLERKAVKPYNTTKLEQLVEAFALWLVGTNEYPTDVYVPINANALNVVLAVRRVLRKREVWGPEFDAPDGQYKLYFSQDSCQLATNAQELANAAEFQNPLTMFSGLVRLIREMYLLTQEAA
jgi:hypothetical protein